MGAVDDFPGDEIGIKQQKFVIAGLAKEEIRARISPNREYQEDENRYREMCGENVRLVVACGLRWPFPT